MSWKNLKVGADFVGVNDYSNSLRIKELERRVQIGDKTLGTSTEVVPGTPFIVGYEVVKSKLRATMSVDFPTGTQLVKVIIVPTGNRTTDSDFQQNKITYEVDLDEDQSSAGHAEFRFVPLLKFNVQYDLVRLVAADGEGGRTKNPERDPAYNTTPLTQFTTPSGSEELLGSGTTNGLTYMTSSTELTSTAAPTNGQFLIGRTGLSPVLGTVGGTSNQIIVTLGAGTIVLSAPQDLHTGASNFTVAGLTVSGLTAKSFLYSGTSSALATTSAPSNGEILIGSTGNNPVKNTITAGQDTTITNGSGSITVGSNSPATTVVTSQFDATSGTTPLDITGLTAALSASSTYIFEAVLFVTADAAGGSKYAIAYSGTVTRIKYNIVLTDNTTDTITVASKQTASAGTDGQVGTTDGFCRITGTIVTNGSGNLTAQFSRNAASGTSSVLTESYFLVKKV